MNGVCFLEFYDHGRWIQPETGVTSWFQKKTNQCHIAQAHNYGTSLLAHVHLLFPDLLHSILPGL